MKCHYEVLGVEINCTSDELKKAYRKLALEWHPDKNLSRLEEAKENFQLIQQAYEILGDPQERAWYDRHKDDILRGGAEQAYKDDCLDVYKYFNTSCFKGYNDGEKGFYTVYRQVFEKISAEDKPFIDDDEDMDIPQFGFSDSVYEEVIHNFYAYWQSYCTAKTFSWVDKYDLTEARKSGAGRQIIRVMEKENKKLRDQHKKMRNEEVRELVSFVRKRDKRVQAHKKKMEELKAEKAKKAEELRKKQVKARNKAFEEYKETEWSSMSQFENHFNEIESNLDEAFGNEVNNENDNDEEFDLSGDLYCVACEKDFRSEKAFKNHENSKKHKENVAILTEIMLDEETQANSENVVENSICEEHDPEETVSSEALLDELIKNSTKSKKKKKKSKALHVDKEIEEQVERLAEVHLSMNDVHSPDECLKTSFNNCVSNAEEQNSDLMENEESINATCKEIKDIKVSSKSDNVKKKGKKDKAQKTETNSGEINEDNGEKPITICGSCKNNFLSRNKLFEHLKQTGHAVYKGEGTSNASGKKQKKKKL